MVQALLRDVVDDGFILHCCGGLTTPTALVATYEWPDDDYIDIVTTRDFQRVTTARLPKQAEIDLFAPHVAVWAYEGSAEPALRALLKLVHPQHPDAPTTEFPAPRSLHIPRHEQRPMRIRPPAPGRAGIRAARLAAMMA